MRAVVALALALALAAPACAAPPPGIVLIVADDLREADLAYLPSLDLVRARGAHFAAAVTTFPLCTPARSELLSGTSHVTTGVTANDAALVDPARPTLGTRLQAAGYRTALVGKLFNKMANLRTQELPGWDLYFALARGNELGRDQTDALADLAARFLVRCKTDPKPCFLYLAPVSPHGPLPGPHACKDRIFPPSPYPDQAHEWARRQSSLCGLDRLIARIADDLLPGTLLIVTSDNGYEFGRGKNELTIDAVHVPLLVTGPDVVPSERNELATGLDVHATILDYAGSSALSDGRSLRPLMGGGQVPRWTGRLVIDAGQGGS